MYQAAGQLLNMLVGICWDWVRDRAGLPEKKNIILVLHLVKWQNASLKLNERASHLTFKVIIVGNKVNALEMDSNLPRHSPSGMRHCWLWKCNPLILVGLKIEGKTFLFVLCFPLLCLVFALPLLVNLRWQCSRQWVSAAWVYKVELHKPKCEKLQKKCP